MLKCEEDEDLDFVEQMLVPLLTRIFSANAVICGPIGAAMVVNSINNVLNTAHLLVASERTSG